MELTLAVAFLGSPLASFVGSLPSVLFLIAAVGVVCLAFLPVRRQSRDMRMDEEWLADFHRRERHQEDD
jgi:hypothetical protein